MTDMTPLNLTSLESLIAEIAAPEPSPGSGAAAAIALSLAAACTAKAFVISNRHNGNSRLLLAAESAHEIARLAIEGAQRDSDDFRDWLKSHDALVLRNDASILLGAADRLVELIMAHWPWVISSLQADLCAAEALVAAFRSIEERNLNALNRS